MYLEYDWMGGVYRPRFGDVFIEVAGERSWATRCEAQRALATRKLAIGRKTDTRTWEIVALRGDGHE